MVVSAISEPGFEVTEVISGGALGVGERFAEERGSGRSDQTRLEPKPSRWPPGQQRIGRSAHCMQNLECNILQNTMSVFYAAAAGITTIEGF